MSERGSAKPKRSVAPKTVGKKPASGSKTASRSTAAVAGSNASLSERAGAGDVELTRLQAELAVARARIAELEQRQTDIANRIDWVIDSLHNLTD